jgi:hypothetical protein|nr:MAG TPA: hypothetical protein [Crassvirales sp.]
MTKEQLEQELVPLEWNGAGFGDIAAYTDFHNGWYRISKVDGAYTVMVDDTGDGPRVLIKRNVPTLKEAKAIAWNDYVDDVLDLFK